jgi:uncharacterized protein YndB with AHSA1/START domain
LGASRWAWSCGGPNVPRVRQNDRRDDAPTGTRKTTAQTDTFHGLFVKLVPNEQVVEVVEFETTDPALRGEMTITIALADADGGTDVLTRRREPEHARPSAGSFVALPWPRMQIGGGRDDRRLAEFWSPRNR